MIEGFHQLDEEIPLNSFVKPINLLFPMSEAYADFFHLVIEKINNNNNLLNENEAEILIDCVEYLLDNYSY